MIVQRFNLNLIPNQSPVVVHVNQYDTGTGRLVATLYEGNEPYSPNGTAVIQGTKPDGHGFQYTATLDGNVVTADLTEQMAPVAGDVRTQIVVTESSGVTGTFAFIIRVQPSALPSDTDMSESDYQYIEEAIREAQEAVQTAQEATETAQEAVERAQEAITETQENAEDSEAWAQGTRGGIPVGPTDPTYEHNAEYWAQYAERYAQGGLHYKGSILFANIPTTGMREGDMYDITDDFTTDSRFTEGAGIEVKGGTNIAWNSDNKWDILALPYIPKTTFNGRSGSILPMAGDYDSKKILLSSALHIGGETQSDVQEALEALSDDGVKSFNGRSGSVLPMAGDYDSEKILLASVLHIGGETQDNVQKALEALEGNKADKVDNAIADNFAGLDANGNLKDSGKNAGDFATPSDIAGQQSLLKDTVGWTGKNRLKVYGDFPKSTQGVTATKNADGSISFSGSATGYASFYMLRYDIEDNSKDYLLTGLADTTTNMAWGNTYVYNSSDEVLANIQSPNNADDRVVNFSQYTSAAYVLFEVKRLNNGTVSGTLYPMLSDDGGPYEPYHESVEEEIEQIYADNGVLGAKNLLEPPSKASTIKGITYTPIEKGKVRVTGTLSEATTSQYNYKTLYVSEGILEAGKTYILNKGVTEYAYIIIWFWDVNGTYINGVSSRHKNEDIVFTVPSNTYRINYVLEVFKDDYGKTVNDVLELMIRLASDPDDTYQPHAMTNRELTDDRYYHAGDTVNVSLMNFAGLITNNSKDIRFTIPLMRDLSKITGITFKNTTTVGIRKPEGGYVVDGTISSGYTIAVLAKAGNLLSLKLTKTDNSAFDATNNTPLDVAFTGGSSDSVITFS